MVKQKQKEGKREQYVVQIGPRLMKCLEEQLESIHKVTYGSVKSSFFEAGEILAKKFSGEV